MRFDKRVHCAALLICAGTAPLAMGKAYTWKSTCQGALNRLYGRVWCENEWNVAGNWSATPSGGYPDDTGDTAVIECDNLDPTKGNWLQVNLSTATIGDVTIGTEGGLLDGPGGVNSLRLVLWYDGTVTCTKFTIDASNGDVSVMAGGSAKLATN